MNLFYTLPILWFPHIVWLFHPNCTCLAIFAFFNCLFDNLPIVVQHIFELLEVKRISSSTFLNSDFISSQLLFSKVILQTTQSNRNASTNLITFFWLDLSFKEKPCHCYTSVIEIFVYVFAYILLCYFSGIILSSSVFYVLITNQIISVESLHSQKSNFEILTAFQIIFGVGVVKMTSCTSAQNWYVQNFVHLLWFRSIYKL